MSKANGDFIEKQILVENLSRTEPVGWPVAKVEILSLFEQAKALLPAVNGSKAKLSELNGQISALSYSHSKIEKTDDLWPRAKQIITEFDVETKRLSQRLNAYSSASNQLADSITRNKLFVAVDLGEFQKRIQTAIVDSNIEIKKMNSHLAKMERILNLSDESTQLNEAQALFERMSSAAKNFSQEAQQLPELSRKVKETTLGTAKVSSIDASWTQVQKLQGEFSEINLHLNKFKQDFNEITKNLGSSLELLKK